MAKPGRPAGSLNIATLEKKKVEEEIQRSIMKYADYLVKSQIRLAKGCNYLYKVITKTNDKGQKFNSKPILVTDKEEIENYLEGNYNPDFVYYDITTEKPDNQAINSLFDRAFGKPKQQVGLDADININKYEHLSERELLERIGDLIGSVRGEEG